MSEIEKKLARLVNPNKRSQLFRIFYNHGRYGVEFKGDETVYNVPFSISGSLLYVKKEAPPARCCSSFRFPHHPTFDQFFSPETFKRYSDLGRENTRQALDQYVDKFFEDVPDVFVPPAQMSVAPMELESKASN